MGAFFFAMVGLETLGEIMLYVGLALALVATACTCATAARHAADPQAQLDRLGYTRRSRTAIAEETHDGHLPRPRLADRPELKDLIQQLTEEETEISYKRRILHGKIDILRAELVNRLRKKHEGGEDVITGADVQQLTDILAGRAATPETADAG